MLSENTFNLGKTPIQRIEDPLLERHKVQLFIKREDELHSTISGNKWRKLKYNLQTARGEGYNTLLTFGGAFSNHIAAVAATGKEFGFGTIGIIRGEEHLPLNPTLAFAQEQGMQLHYMDRETYRNKKEPEVTDYLAEKFGSFYLIPEGGSNALAVQGCTEIINEIDKSAYDFVCAPCGTGGTLAGLVAGMNRSGQVLGFPALKGGSFLKEEIDSLTKAYNSELYHNYQLLTDYHFGGYAKWTPELVNFINTFKDATGVPLDPIYTGKMLFGIYDLIQKGFFKPHTRLLAIHTGGLQGIKGFNQRFANLL
jgi:1-aminocyclopropane-1-carboxylate deaminase